MADKLFVCKGATCKCTLQTTPGILNVTSQSIKKLEGKLQATEGDKTFSTPFGGCKRSSKKPLCTPALSSWSTTAQQTRISGKLALLEISTNTCSFGGQIEITNPNQTIGRTADLPVNEIINPFKGEVHFRRKLEPSGAYAVFPNGLTDAIETQEYGFDWIRDYLDGEENYLSKHKYPVSQEEDEQMYSVGDELSTAMSGVFQRTVKVRFGRYFHFVDFDSINRKLKSEQMVWLSDAIVNYTGTYMGSKNSGEFLDELENAMGEVQSSVTLTNFFTENYTDLIEYGINRSIVAIHPSTSAGYTNIVNKLGGAYNTAETSLLLTSFDELTNAFTPIKNYIDTPLGTEIIGDNTGKTTLNINGKNYYTPWLSVLKSETVKLYALSFLDEAVTSGEIQFKSSSPKITITPTTVAVSGLAIHQYPTINQTSDLIPATNKEELEISFTDAIAADETIEARFFDDTKKADPNYKGDIVGLLNVCKNDIEYDLTARYVKVYFTDNNNWLPTTRGGGDNKLPVEGGFPSSIAPLSGFGIHSKANQLARGEDLMNLFKSQGGQDEHLEKTFKQALIHYKASVFLSDAIAVDVSEIYPNKTATEGLSFSPIDNRPINISFPSKSKSNFFFSNKVIEIVKKKVNARNGRHNGVTVMLLPYTFPGLAGVSEDIGGVAQNVLITLRLFDIRTTERLLAPHEVLHSLGLHHTFPSNIRRDVYIYKKEEAVTNFVEKMTENIMDYSDPGRSIYKWQWEKIRKDFPDVVPKP